MIAIKPLVLISLLLLAGCNRGTPTASTAPAPGNATNTGEADAIHLGRLEFRIVASYENQQLTDDFPGHADGGNWTFLDCLAGDVPFVVGLQKGAPPAALGAAADNPGEWATHGHALLRTADRDTAGAFLSAFAGAFQTPLPEPLAPKPLHTQIFSTAILGTDLNRAPSGNGLVMGGGGTWTSTRWIVATPRLQAEVFFNYDLDAKRGEFVEKDVTHREELLTLWARILRDGPRGLRSPQEDHNVVMTGPHLATPAQIGGPAAHHPVFVPGGKWLVYLAPTADGQKQQIWEVECAQPDNRRLVMELPVIFQVQSADPEGQSLLVEEKIPDLPGQVTNADPSRFIWCDLTAGSARAVNGPWNPRDVDLNADAISPDSHYMLLSESRTRTDGKGGYTEFYFVDLQANTASAVDINQQWLEPLNWHSSTDGLRLAARTGLDIDPPEKRQACLIDPATGNWVAATADEVPPIVAAQRPSPDGQNIADVVDRQRLEIHRAAGITRELVFNPEDHHFVDDQCVAWLDNRYMSFFNPYPIIIDTRVMKMNYLLDTDRVPNDVVYSKEFKYAAVTMDDGLYLARVEMPH